MSSCTVNHTTTKCSVGTINETIATPIMQFLGGFVGNILALFILIKTKKNHKWKPFYRLVCALAITDATVSSLAYPFSITRYATQFTYCYSITVCHHVAFILSFAFLGSALIVTSISFDRFLAILFPFKYDSSRKIQRRTAMILSSWVITAVICALPLIGVGEVKFYYPETWCFIDFTSKDSSNEIITYIYALLGLLLFFLTFIFNLSVIIALIRRIRRSKKRLGHQKHLKSDIYNVVFLLGIVLVFSACWVPLTTRMIYNINSECPNDGPTELLVARLAITNSIVDPWVYIVLRKENFERLEQLIARCRNTHESDNNAGSLPTIASALSLNSVVISPYVLIRSTQTSINHLKDK